VVVKREIRLLICHKPQGHSNIIVIGQDGVSNHLAHGDMLGACVIAAEPITERQTRSLDILLNEFSIKAMPNPSSNYFIISIEGITGRQKASLKVTDLLGRVIEHKENIQNNINLKIGNNYQPGIYIVEFIQGTTRKQFKLIKSGK
jgi:hypothetical protein